MGKTQENLRPSSSPKRQADRDFHYFGTLRSQRNIEGILKNNKSSGEGIRERKPEYFTKEEKSRKLILEKKSIVSPRYSYERASSMSRLRTRQLCNDGLSSWLLIEPFGVGFREQ